jgi:hypothetical protein
VVVFPAPPFWLKRQIVFAMGGVLQIPNKPSSNNANTPRLQALQPFFKALKPRKAFVSIKAGEMIDGVDIELKHPIFYGP